MRGFLVSGQSLESVNNTSIFCDTPLRGDAESPERLQSLTFPAFRGGFPVSPFRVHMNGTNTGQDSLMNNEFLTAEQAAKRAGVSRPTVKPRPEIR